MTPTMAKPPSERQAALRLLCRAARALGEEGALDADTVRALVPSWRALAPHVHATAADDHVDAGVVARAHALGVLEATQLVVARGAPRAPPRAHGTAPRTVTLVGHAPADALALALSLSLEAAKRAHKLPTVVDDLKRAFASPEDARKALDALTRGGDGRALALDTTAPSLDGHRLRTLARDRPIYVVTGSGCWRVHDLLSPWVRRLGRKLALLANSSGRDEDDAYAGVRALYAHEPAVHAERLAVEERDGFLPLGDALVVQPENVPDAGADRRVHESLRQLKKARALLVLVDDANALAAVLAALAPAADGVRVVGALVTALGTDALVRPARIVDLASGVIVPLDNAAGAAEGALTSLPSLAFAYDGLAGAHDAEAFALTQAVLAHGHTRTALVAFPHGDDRSHTRAAIEFLSRMGTPPPEGKPPPRRR